jgi:hypothetical protein
MVDKIPIIGYIRILMIFGGNFMEYYRVDTDYDPKITGKRDGAFAVEKNRKSFSSKDWEKKFNIFFIENIKNKKRTSLDDYIVFETADDFLLTYYPRTKSVKKLDFMAYGPHEHGIQFLISQKVYEIIYKHKLPVHNKIPVKIDTFDNQYFLLGFPLINFLELDFSKSVFHNYNDGKIEIFEDFNDYNNCSIYNRKMAHPHKLIFKNKINYDIIDTVKGTYFSNDIIEEFNEQNIIGYCIKEEYGILEN